MLAEWAPEPLVLPFVLFAVSASLATIAVLAIPEPGRVVAGACGSCARASHPRSASLFARVSITGAAVWAVAALFLSVVPSYAADLLDTSNLALLGAVSAVALATSCVGADRRPALARARPHAGRGPRPARPGAARARARLPGAVAARPAARAC